MKNNKSSLAEQFAEYKMYKEVKFKKSFLIEFGTDLNVTYYKRDKNGL